MSRHTDQIQSIESFLQTHLRIPTGFVVSKNQHKTYGEKIDAHYRSGFWISRAERQAAIDSDTVWSVAWFHEEQSETGAWQAALASTLEAAMMAAQNMCEHSPECPRH